MWQGECIKVCVSNPVWPEMVWMGLVTFPDQVINLQGLGHHCFYWFVSDWKKEEKLMHGSQDAEEKDRSVGGKAWLPSLPGLRDWTYSEREYNQRWRRVSKTWSTHRGVFQGPCDLIRHTAEGEPFSHGLPYARAAQGSNSDQEVLNFHKGICHQAEKGASSRRRRLSETEVHPWRCCWAPLWEPLGTHKNNQGIIWGWT